LSELQLKDTQRWYGIVPRRARLAGANVGNDTPIMLDLTLAKGEDVAAVEIILRQGQIAIVEGDAGFELA
jgi:hypothetical protein